LAYVSYYITGYNDSSILCMPDEARHGMMGDISNWVGLPGALLSRLLVDGSFGIPSIIIPVVITLFGLKLLRFTSLNGWRIFFCGAFWLIWGSTILSFLQQMIGIDTFFRWGGAHGAWLSALLTGYIRPLGMMILLLATLIVFLILSDSNFLPNMSRLSEWLRCRLSRNKTEQDDSTDQADNQPTAPSDPVEIVIETDSESTIDTIPPDQPTDAPIVVEITTTPAEETIQESPVDEPSIEVVDTPAAGTADAPLEIEKPNEEAMATEEEDTSDPDYWLNKLGPFDPRKDLETYQFPALSLLKVYDNETAPVIDPAEQQANANRIVTTLRNYGIEIDSIKATVGPTVTLYEVVPKAGIRIAKIQSLENDIMLSLSAIGIRIIAPMPGKGTVGIEVPNEKPQVVSMHSVIASKRFQEEKKMKLPVALGRTITNEVFMFDLAKTPHLLVAGATGQGKSVGLNAIITSLLYKKHPAELKLVLVDPKMVEFSIYKPLLRHYMAAMPDQEDGDIIITDCQKVINTLNSLVIEMEERYTLLAEANVRTVEDYNEKFTSRRLNPERAIEKKDTHAILHHHYMPYLVIVIDEYGDFIMQAGKEVERPIQRIAQKARAVGMHMILATQRPDVKIVTGTIKANIPTRIAFRTQSVVDSRTVLDQKGAEQLIGKGDMLYAGGGNLTRIQCAFVDTPEVEAIVNHVSTQQHYLEPYQLPEYVPEGSEEAVTPGSVDMKRLDPMFADVARYVVSKQEGSTSRLQRAFEIGYNRAGKLSDQLEAAGIVGPNKGPKGRDVLIQDMESLENLLQSLNA